MKDKKPNPNRDRARELASKIARMSDADRQAFAAHAPIATVDGRILSFKNMALASMQTPDATIVGGFRQWIAAGRCVKAGESAIYIWIPSTRRADPEKQEGEISSGDLETRFFLAPVFDVMQTAELVAMADAA